MNGKNNAYVTLISGNSMVIGAIVLWQSWKESKSAFPFYALVTDNVSSKNIELLNGIGMRTIIRPMLMMPENILEYDINCDLPCLMGWIGAWSKFYLFSLTQFSKIVYLDQDMIIRKNIDCLFDYPDMSAVKDDGCSGREYWLDPKDQTARYPNGGLLVVEPKKGKFEKMMSIAASINPVFPLNDQSVWVYLDPDWPIEENKHISPTYNSVPLHHISLDSCDNDAVIHYIFLKPWKIGRDAKTGNPLVDKLNVLWWNFFDRIDPSVKNRCDYWQQSVGPLSFLSEVQRNYHG